MDYPDWGADGAIYVAIDSNVPDPNSPPLTFEIWRIDPPTGDARAVVTREDQMTVEQPRLSPDGTQLVYARERIADGKWAIFVADIAGGPERQLHRLGHGRGLSRAGRLAGSCPSIPTTSAYAMISPTRSAR